MGERQVDLARAMIQVGHGQALAHRILGLWSLLRCGANFHRSQRDDSSKQ
jgi:hypothetical protein